MIFSPHSQTLSQVPSSPLRVNYFPPKLDVKIIDHVISVLETISDSGLFVRIFYKYLSQLADHRILYDSFPVESYDVTSTLKISLEVRS